MKNQNVNAEMMQKFHIDHANKTIVMEPTSTMHFLNIKAFSPTTRSRFVRSKSAPLAKKVRIA